MKPLDMALSLAGDLGFHVFPLEFKGKAKKGHMSEKYSESGQPWGASNDADEIKNAWVKFPQGQLGIACGPASGVWVVEGDIKNDVDGVEWLEREFLRRDGKTPDTIMQKSPTGSVHYLFAWPGQGVDIRNSQSEIAPGVDVRGNGGMIAAAPSARPDGAYQWIQPPGLFDLEPAPQWLVDMAIAASGKTRTSAAHSATYDMMQEGKSADDYAALIRGMKTDGQKHASVRDIAASMAAQGCSKRFVEGFIKVNCPVYDRNVQASIDSAFEKYAKPQEPIEDADPVDLWGSFDPPELPAGLLPPIIEQFARVNGAQMGADPAGLAMGALVTCAAAIPDRVQIKVKRHDDWKESARLWAALVGLPSTKKSPVINAATAPLCSIDMKMMRAWQKRVREYEALSAEEKKGKQRPLQTRLRIEDTTVEAAQEVLSGSPWGVLMRHDELSGFFGSLDRYNAGGAASANRAFWLQSYNGGEYANNRVGRGAVIIDNLSVSLLGGIQPEPLRKVAGDSVDDGLLQRIMPVMLKSAVMGRDDPMPPINDEYKSLIEKLHQLLPPGWMGEGVLEFDEEAQKIRRDLEARHMELDALEAINRKLASHIGKYDGLFARLCVVWHCVEYVSDMMLCGEPAFDSEGLPATVTERTAQRVADFLHSFILRHAIAFYGGILGLSDDHDKLTAIAGYILAHKVERITNRDVQASIRTMRGLKEHETRPVLEQLAALGWLERVDGPRPSSPPHWQVNPAVHTKFADKATRETQRRQEVREIIQQVALVRAKA